MAVMCTPEGNKFLFSNETKLVQSWWPTSFRNIFFMSESGHHDKTFCETTRQLRKLVVPSFLKPQSLRSYAETLDSLTKRHLQDHWEGKGVVRVQELARILTFELACRLFLSVEDDGLVKKLEGLVVHIAAGMVSLPVDLPGTRYRRAFGGSRAFRREIVDLIKKRRENNASGEQDLLSFLLRHVDENGEFLSEVDICDKVQAVMVGAYDPIATSIVSIVNYLADLPHVYDQVRREQMEIANSKGKEELLNWEDIQKMTYSWNVAREVLRLVPPVFGTFREAIIDFEFQGFFIPKGWKIHWNVYATHKNPEYFSNLEKFDPPRYEGNGPIPYSYIPFGGGLRMCPGYEFARFEILVFVHNLVTKYKFEKVYSDEKIICNPNPAPTKGLPIHLYSH